MKTVAQLLRHTHKLNKVSDSARLDTELLLCFCLQKPRSYLRAWPDATVNSDVTEQFETLLSRREQGEPVAYLVGEQGFWSLDLNVNNSTLIPRPETELLVETILHLLAEKNRANVLDLGTGTGAIVLALASERPKWQLLACDKEADAVALAQSNQQKYQLNNVNIIQSNWFDSIEPQVFDLIVSNPPYIDANDPHLQLGDVSYEPCSALVAANNGLADLDKIIYQSQTFLVQGAWLVVEHGYDQAQSVQQLFSKNGFKEIFCKQDLAGIDRISGGQFVC